MGATGEESEELLARQRRPGTPRTAAPPAGRDARVARGVQNKKVSRSGEVEDGCGQVLFILTVRRRFLSNSQTSH